MYIRCVLPSPDTTFTPFPWGLAYPSRHSSLNSRPFNLLQPLCRRQKSQLLWNQANPASFCKTPGVGVPPQTSPLESSTSSLFFRAPVATQLTPQLTPMLLITSVQTQHFHAITHFHPEPNPRRAFAQRRQPICFFYKGLRTLLPLTNSFSSTRFSAPSAVNRACSISSLESALLRKLRSQLL